MAEQRLCKVYKSKINVVCCVGGVQMYSKYKKVGVLPIRIKLSASAVHQPFYILPLCTLGMQ